MAPYKRKKEKRIDRDKKKAVTKTIEISTEKTPEKNTDVAGGNISGFKLLAMSGAFLYIIPIFVRSLISGGIGSWMPTMIMESYGVSPEISSLMTTISTIANLAAIVWVILLYPRVFKLQTTAVGMLFLFTVPFLAASAFIGQIPMIFIVLFITVTNTFKGSIHQFNTVEIPAAYTKYNKAGMIAGLINSVATAAGIISSWLWGFMAENYSWNIIIIMWTVMALLAAVCCFIMTPKWKKFVKNRF